MELDAMLLGSLTVLFSFFGMIVFFAVRVMRTPSTAVNRDEILAEIRANAGGAARQRGPVVVGGRRRGAGNVRHRGGRNDDDDLFRDDDDAEADDFLDDDVAGVDGKLGKKKLAKLEAKAEKRANREYELSEREEKKKAKADQEEQDREERQKEIDEEKAREEEERIAKEKKEKEEYEEYLKMKEAFAVEKSGFDELSAESEENMRQKFVEHIKQAKVVNMDELGSAFNMKSSSVVGRVQSMLADGAIQGVIDDRGKFIYISDDELNAVAKFINQRGRISMAELANHSNTLVSMEGST